METRMGRVQWGGPGVGSGTRERTSAANWRKPLAWDKKAKAEGRRPFVFCSSLADVFDNEVPAEWRRDLFELIIQTPNLVWLLLTKRPQNIVKMVKEIRLMPKNIAFGTTIEDRERAQKNLPGLIVAAGLRPLFLFASCEPLVGDLGDLTPWMQGDPYPQRLSDGETYRNGIKIGADGWPKLPAVAWWISGGETDQGAHKARPTHPGWFRSIRDQALDHGLAYHHKQNGEWVSVSEVAGPGTHFKFEDGATVRRIGKKLSGRTIDGVTHNAFPEVANG
jgi:protein gp37